MKKSTGFRVPEPSERFSFETTHTFWIEIANNLESWADQLKKELDVVEKHLPDSHTYWTISSNLADATSAAKQVREFVDSNFYSPKKKICQTKN